MTEDCFGLVRLAPAACRSLFCKARKLRKAAALVAYAAPAANGWKVPLTANPSPTKRTAAVSEINRSRLARRICGKSPFPSFEYDAAQLDGSHAPHRSRPYTPLRLSPIMPAILTSIRSGEAAMPRGPFQPKQPCLRRRLSAPLPSPQCGHGPFLPGFGAHSLR